MVASLRGSAPAGGEHIVEDSADLTGWMRVSPLLKPSGGALIWSFQSGPSVVRNGIQYPDIFARGAATWYNRRFYRMRALPPADAVPRTVPVTPRGRLTRPDPEGPFRFTTGADWRVTVDGTQVIIESPDTGADWEVWGAGPHENLNGKHIKDWESRRRTILLPGDTTITLTSGEQTAGAGAGVITLRTVSIYDAVEMSALLSRAGEAAEADGETMRIWHLGGGRHHAVNIYVREETGEVLEPRVSAPLGSTGGEANPWQVSDYYDDPRYGHT